MSKGYGLKFGRLIQCNPAVYIFMEPLKNIQNLPFFEQNQNIFLEKLGLEIGVQCTPKSPTHSEVSESLRLFRDAATPVNGRRLDFF